MGDNNLAREQQKKEYWDTVSLGNDSVDTLDSIIPYINLKKIFPIPKFQERRQQYKLKNSSSVPQSIPVTLPSSSSFHSTQNHHQQILDTTSNTMSYEPQNQQQHQVASPPASLPVFSTFRHSQHTAMNGNTNNDKITQNTPLLALRPTSDSLSFSAPVAALSEQHVQQQTDQTNTIVHSVTTDQDDDDEDDARSTVSHSSQEFNVRPTVMVRPTIPIISSAYTSSQKNHGFYSNNHSHKDIKTRDSVSSVASSSIVVSSPGLKASSQSPSLASAHSSILVNRTKTTTPPSQQPRAQSVVSSVQNSQFDVQSGVPRSATITPHGFSQNNQVLESTLNGNQSPNKLDISATKSNAPSGVSLHSYPSQKQMSSSSSSHTTFQDHPPSMTSGFTDLTSISRQHLRQKQQDTTHQQGLQLDNLPVLSIPDKPYVNATNATTNSNVSYNHHTKYNNNNSHESNVDDIDRAVERALEPTIERLNKMMNDKLDKMQSVLISQAQPQQHQYQNPTQPSKQQHSSSAYSTNNCPSKPSSSFRDADTAPSSSSTFNNNNNNHTNNNYNHDYQSASHQFDFTRHIQNWSSLSVDQKIKRLNEDTLMTEEEHQRIYGCSKFPKELLLCTLQSERKTQDFQESAMHIIAGSGDVAEYLLTLFGFNPLTGNKSDAKTASLGDRWEDVMKSERIQRMLAEYHKISAQDSWLTNPKVVIGGTLMFELLRYCTTRGVHKNIIRFIRNWWQNNFQAEENSTNPNQAPPQQPHFIPSASSTHISYPTTTTTFPLGSNNKAQQPQLLSHATSSSSNKSTYSGMHAVQNRSKQQQEQPPLPPQQPVVGLTQTSVPALSISTSNTDANDVLAESFDCTSAPLHGAQSSFGGIMHRAADSFHLLNKASTRGRKGTIFVNNQPQITHVVNDNDDNDSDEDVVDDEDDNTQTDNNSKDLTSLHANGVQENKDTISDQFDKLAINDCSK